MHSLKVYIILVNWNGWRDTIECLESVFRLRYPDFSVIVCDNDSSDGSLDRIGEWAEGRIAAGCTNPALAHLTAPPAAKPIAYGFFDRPGVLGPPGRGERLLLIQTGANLGFAGGNNLGLRYALACGDLGYAWLLNNDTVVSPDALARLVERMQKRPDAGIGGSTLLDYGDPTKVQVLGGSIYNRWVARGGNLGADCLAVHNLISQIEVESRMKYVTGASMLVSKAFLETVGLMNEEYFLYFEELDWAVRGGRSFRLVYSPESIVYHKLGGSIGTARLTRNFSEKAEYFAARNRLRFTRKYFPYALPTVCLALAASVGHRLLGGKWKNARAIVRAMLHLPLLRQQGERKPAL